MVHNLFIMFTSRCSKFFRELMSIASLRMNESIEVINKKFFLIPKVFESVLHGLAECDDFIWWISLIFSSSVLKFLSEIPPQLLVISSHYRLVLSVFWEKNVSDGNEIMKDYQNFDTSTADRYQLDITAWSDEKSIFLCNFYISVEALDCWWGRSVQIYFHSINNLYLWIGQCKYHGWSEPKYRGRSKQRWRHECWSLWRQRITQLFTTFPNIQLLTISQSGLRFTENPGKRFQSCQKSSNFHFIQKLNSIHWSKCIFRSIQFVRNWLVFKRNREDSRNRI